MGIVEGAFQNVASLYNAGGFTAVLVPKDFIASTRVFCDAAFSVDWGNGSPISYAASTQATAVPTGTITLTSTGATHFRCETNTIISMDITGGTQLTSVNQMCWRLSNMTSFTVDNLDNVTDAYAAWQSCTGLTSFPAVNMPSCIDLFYTWSGCLSLTSFPLIDVSANKVFYNTWAYCYGLTAFPVLDLSAATSVYAAWQSCTGLTSFPNLNVSSVTNFYQAWFSCTNLTSFSIAANFSSGTDFRSTFAYCRNLTSLGLLATESGTQFNSMFSRCYGLRTIGALDTTGTVGATSNLFFATSITSPNLTEQADLADINGANFN